jgi:nucleotide-binding universal stress UspA family protein
MPGIVVGVDGSEQSQRALNWAIKEAGLRNTSLTVLAVHQVAGNHWTGTPVQYPADAPETEKMRQAAQETVQKAVDAAGSPGPASVTVRAVSGIAAQELISASNDADLVVVANRGGGGFARLMLGSTSNQVVNHSASPVVVFREGPS